MEYWNEIINTALLGTGKKMPEKNLLPADISPLADVIQQQAADKEELFLQTASLVFNYRQCGFNPFQKEGLMLTKAPAEEKSFCSAQALRVLKDILELESNGLLTLWLNRCNEKQQIVLPEVIPQLLQLAVQQKKLRTAIVSCCGKKGHWLCQFNPEWNFASAASDEEIWQTGALEQRKQVLATVRESNPAQALDWLQQTWQQEDANTKTELLQLLQTNIGPSDIPFLESLATEKSKKVKELAVNLLKKIPQSAIVQQYATVIKNALRVKKERALLGLSSKTALHIQLPAIDESVFKTGIEKLSNSKELSDDLFIIYQLMLHVPLSLYEEWWQLKPEEIINHFQKDAAGQKLMTALVLSCINFKDYQWAIYLVQYCSTFYIDLIPLLPLQQKEYYSNKFFSQEPDNIIQYATQREEEWSIELTKNIFLHTAKNQYQYPRSFYNQHIHLIPGKIAPGLDKFNPGEIQPAWANMSDYILKLLNLKTQIFQTLNN